MRAPGGIAVDRMRTNMEGIWAVGDVVAAPQFTPVGAERAQVAVEDMFGDGARRIDYSILPNAIFTDPELASVGRTEDEARMQGFEVETSSYSAADILRSYYMLPRGTTPHGLVKIVYERGSGRLLGVHALVKGGAELTRATPWRCGWEPLSTTSPTRCTRFRRWARPSTTQPNQLSQARQSRADATLAAACPRSRCSARAR